MKRSDEVVAMTLRPRELCIATPTFQPSGRLATASLLGEMDGPGNVSAHPITHAVEQLTAEGVGRFYQQGDNGAGCGFPAVWYDVMRIAGFRKYTKKP